MDDLLADFLTETNEGLATLDVVLLKLEKAPDDRPTLSEIFRSVHTIKGTCGFLGLSRLEKVAHAAENVLGKYREGALKVTPEGITLILSAIDCLKSIVTGLETTGSEPQGDDSALIAALDAAWRGEPIGTPAKAAPPPPADPAIDPFEALELPVVEAPPEPVAAEPAAAAP
ncbi:Hpt domain-containing protein, partial [Roseomonas aerophila]